MSESVNCPVATGLRPLLDTEPEAIEIASDYFDQLRALGPVVWVDELDAYAVTDHAAVVEVLNDFERFAADLGNPRGPRSIGRFLAAQAELSETSPEFHELAARLKPDWRAEPILNMLDGDRHQAQRKLVARLFTPKRVDTMEVRAREIASRLVATIDPSQPTEVVAAFCSPLPLTMVAEQLGMPPDHLGDFKRWIDDITAMIGNDNLTADHVYRVTKTLVEFSEYFRPMLDARRRAPEDDFVGTLVEADDPTYPMNDEARLGIISAMIGAGNETSTKMLASGARILAGDHALADRLRADPGLIARFVEEVVRLEAPIQGFFRTVRTDTELAGVPLKGGTPIWVLYASANRCPAAFDDATAVDLERSKPEKHVGFGHGRHFCVGASLARMVGRVGFETLVSALPNWTIDDAAGGVTFDRSYVLHGPRTLWLRFPDAAPSGADAPDNSSRARGSSTIGAGDAA